MNIPYPQRKPNRLPAFDYSSNRAYFVTICTQDRKNTLCRIVGDGLPVPKPYGTIVASMIPAICDKFPQVHIDHFVVMPNHIHLLLFIDHSAAPHLPSPTLGSVIGWYKYQTTKQINQSFGAQGTKVFQRSYHDHVIRDDRDYLKIWNYIDTNPLRWIKDCFYSED